MALGNVPDHRKDFFGSVIKYRVGVSWDRGVLTGTTMTARRCRKGWLYWVLIAATFLNVVGGNRASAGRVTGKSGTTTAECPVASMPDCHPDASGSCCCTKNPASQSNSIDFLGADTPSECNCSVGVPEEPSPAITTTPPELGKFAIGLAAFPTRIELELSCRFVHLFEAETGPPGRFVHTPGPSRAPPAPCNFAG